MPPRINVILYDQYVWDSFKVKALARSYSELTELNGKLRKKDYSIRRQLKGLYANFAA